MRAGNRSSALATGLTLTVGLLAAARPVASQVAARPVASQVAARPVASQVGWEPVRRSPGSTQRCATILPTSNGPTPSVSAPSSTRGCKSASGAPSSWRRGTNSAWWARSRPDVGQPAPGASPAAGSASTTPTSGSAWGSGSVEPPTPPSPTDARPSFGSVRPHTASDSEVNVKSRALTGGTQMAGAIPPDSLLEMRTGSPIISTLLSRKIGDSL